MKVVINKCYGGFGLSSECVWALMDSGSLKKSTYKEYFGVEDCPWSKDDIKKLPWLPEGFVFDRWGSTLLDTKNRFVYSFDDYDHKMRACPFLVELVELHGSEWASGPCAKLAIVEIPNDVDFYVDEYDGMESVHEQHESWY